MPKRIIPLSAIKIDKAKPQEKAYKLYDGGGLVLLVTPTGGKLWYLRYRFRGKEKKLAIAREFKCFRETIYKYIQQKETNKIIQTYSQPHIKTG